MPTDDRCAMLCRLIEWVERQAHLLGKNVEIETQHLIEKIRETK